MTEGGTMKTPHVEVWKGSDGDYYFRFVAANGEQITRSSEGYRNRVDALDAAMLAHGGQEHLMIVDLGEASDATA